MARLSGSVNEIWLSPVRSSSASSAWCRSRRWRSAVIFSAKFFTRVPPAALSAASPCQTLEIVVQLRVGLADERGQRRAREVTILVVDRLDPGAIHRDQLPPKQVQLTAQQNELPEHSSKGSAVVTAEVGNGLEVGLEVAK